MTDGTNPRKPDRAAAADDLGVSESTVELIERCQWGFQCAVTAACTADTADSDARGWLERKQNEVGG